MYFPHSQGPPLLADHTQGSLFLKTYKMETQEAEQHQNCSDSLKLLKEANGK